MAEKAWVIPSFRSVNPPEGVLFKKHFSRGKYVETQDDDSYIYGFDVNRF